MSARMYRGMVFLVSMLVVIHMIVLSLDLWNKNQSPADLEFLGLQQMFDNNHTEDTKELTPSEVSSIEDFQLSMREHIGRSCKELGLETNVTKLSREFLGRSRILVNDKYKLLYCQVPKVATTTWRRIFISLSDKFNITNLMTISANDAHHKYKDSLTYLSQLSQDQIIYRVQNYFKFIFVREPFGRLLSAFRNKFEVQTNASRYFQKIFGRKIIKRYRRYAPAMNSGADIRFDEFVRYLVDVKRRVPMNEHWDKINHLCHPCVINYNFIGKLETFNNDAKYILMKNSLSEKVKIPSRSESRYGNYTTNSLLSKYYALLSRVTLRKLYKTYLSEFTMFKYSVPDVIKNLL